MDVPLGYDLLVDPDLPPTLPRTTVDLPAGAPVTTAAGALEQFLRQTTGPAEVVIAVEGQPVGATSRAFIAAEFPTATRALGDGDRAAQPGQSTAYRLIRFECGSCDRAVYRVFYDERTNPVCEEAGHGRMRLAP
ncbi:hypothetical protein FHX81_6989 [Saccharothrix saharensis]|uniref:Uncharacterized protein n=1 Tax=Saccharothrix saharensis TaxID=571190 RepID=A0A543JP47_9PSEU|nr:hypothetical protein [Saccharothrix saharensis]TQM84534.1 hypothetical protein FHX81_6989 [Saccharothrix saharensis]